MNDLTSILKELFQNGQTWVILPIIVVIIAFNFKNIYFFIFDTLRKAKVKDIENVIELKSFDEKTKVFLNEYLEREKFKIVTGVNWEKDLRLEVLNLCSDKCNNLYFDKFKRASYYVKFDNSKIIVNVNKFEKIGFYFNLLFGILLIFFGLIPIIYLLQFKLTLIQIFTMISLCIVFIYFGFFMVRDAAIIKNAFDIKKELSRLSLENTNNN